MKEQDQDERSAIYQAGYSAGQASKECDRIPLNEHKNKYQYHQEISALREENNNLHDRIRDIEVNLVMNLEAEVERLSKINVNTAAHGLAAIEREQNRMAELAAEKAKSKALVDAVKAWRDHAERFHNNAMSGDDLLNSTLIWDNVDTALAAYGTEAEGV